MLWDSAFILAMSYRYRYRCRFLDDDSYPCHSLIKDWKGKVLLELETVGTRER